MTIPLWAWPLIALACILVVAAFDSRRILRKAANFSAVEAERKARENTAPLGNAERLW